MDTQFGTHGFAPVMQIVRMLTSVMIQVSLISIVLAVLEAASRLINGINQYQPVPSRIQPVATTVL